MQVRREAEDPVGLLRIVDLEGFHVALPVAEAGDALRLRELLLALANVPVGQQRRERVGESVTNLDEQPLLLRAPRPHAGALVKAQDPRMPHLGVDGHSEDCTRPGNTVRNDHGGDLLGVELDGRVGLKQSTVPSGRSVCQRQLYAELEAARILGPRALHDRYPGVAVRFEQPRAVAVGPDGRARRHAHLWRGGGLSRLWGRVSRVL